MQETDISMFCLSTFAFAFWAGTSSSNSSPSSEKDMALGSAASLSWAPLTASGSSSSRCFAKLPPVTVSASPQFTFSDNSDSEASVIVQRSNVNNLGSLLSFTRNNKCRICCSQLKVEQVADEEACELVKVIELSIGEEDDMIRAYLCKAVKNNNGTGILLLSDIFGCGDSATRDFAYRLACNGYNVLVPDLFRGDPWTKERPMALFEEWRTRQDQQRVAKDIFTSAKWMVSEFAAAGISKKLGIIGFCFGGGQVIDILAEDKGACFGVGVSFYGTRINTSVALNISVPVLFITGDDDLLCRVDVLKDLEKEIKGSKVIVYKGRGHAFAHRPQSPEEDEDAEKAFVIMRNWLHDGLIAET